VLTVGTGNFTFRGDGVISVPNVNVGNGVIYVPAGHRHDLRHHLLRHHSEGRVGQAVLSGDNQFTGNANANEGTLNVQRSTALGSPASATNVRANAALELEQTTFGPLVIGWRRSTWRHRRADEPRLPAKRGREQLRRRPYNFNGNLSNILAMYGGWMGVTSVTTQVNFIGVAPGRSSPCPGRSAAGPTRSRSAPGRWSSPARSPTSAAPTGPTRAPPS